MTYRSEVSYCIILAITAVGAFTDARSGRIPNWLTFPAILAAPIYYGLFGGQKWMLYSTLGLVLISVGPLVAFNAKGMKGGDVKMYAAVGAWLWPELAFVALLASALLGMVGGLLTSARKGASLMSILQNIGTIMRNPFRSKRRRVKIDIEPNTKFRLGPYIFLGVASTVAYALLRG